MGTASQTPGLLSGEVSPWREFAGDLKVAGLAWVRAPALPIVTMVIAGLIGLGIQASNGGLKFIAEILAFLSLGFYGTQRIWYLRLFRGQPLKMGEVLPLTWKFLGRFLTLGFLTGLPLLLFYFVYVNAWVVSAARRGAVLHKPLVWYVLPLALTIGIDFLLTFVTPALAYSTRSAVEALHFGLRMIRTTWPSAVFYVFFPPLALQLLVFQPERVIGSRAVYVSAAAIAALINLLFKGAVAAFYLRYVDGVGDSGAAEAAPPHQAIPGAAG